MSNQKVSKIAKVISWLLIVLLLVGIVGIIIVFTNGGEEEFKTFYLVHNDEMILTANSQMDFETGKEYRFDVKYTFDTGIEEPRDYNVKIVAKTDVPFEFTVGNKQYDWRGENDLTKAFDLEKESTHFTLRFAEGFTLQTVLESLYEGSIGVTEPEDRCLYTLIVSSYNNKVTYRIDFSVANVVIRLDPEGVIFG